MIMIIISCIRRTLVKVLLQQCGKLHGREACSTMDTRMLSARWSHRCASRDSDVTKIKKPDRPRSVKPFSARDAVKTVTVFDSSTGLMQSVLVVPNWQRTVLRPSRSHFILLSTIACLKKCNHCDVFACTSVVCFNKFDLVWFDLIWFSRQPVTLVGDCNLQDLKMTDYTNTLSHYAASNLFCSQPHYCSRLSNCLL